MKSHILLLAGLALIAGLSTGCSGSIDASADAEERSFSVVSDQVTPEEAALIASEEGELDSSPNPISLETR